MSGEPSATPHHLKVSRTARYYTLGDTAAGTAEAWFVCHGYRQLAGRFVRRFDAIASPDRLIVAPEALSRFYLDTEPGPHGPESRIGATWMTREDRQNEIADYVEYLDTLREHVLGRSTGTRVTALGFSQGAATASRWVAYGAGGPARLILWAGLLPPDLDLGRARARLRATEIVYVIGDADDYTSIDAAERQRSELEEHGLEARLVRFEGGHRIDRRVLGTLAGGA